MNFKTLTVLLSAFFIANNEVSGCSSNTECPIDQCCGGHSLDPLGLRTSTCRPYSKEGEACHGSLVWTSCDCEEGLECVEHSGLLSLFHTSNGICRQPGTPDPGLLSSLIG